MPQSAFCAQAPAYASLSDLQDAASTAGSLAALLDFMVKKARHGMAPEAEIKSARSLAHEILNDLDVAVSPSAPTLPSVLAAVV